MSATPPLPAPRATRDVDEIRIQQLRGKLNLAIRVRYIVLPLILALWGLLSLVGMETWRHVCLGGLIVVALVVMLQLDHDARKTPQLLPQKLRFFFPMATCVHGFMILVTGGLFSPMLPILLLVMVISGTYWRSLRSAVGVPVTATIVLTVIALADGLDLVPSLEGLSPADPSGVTLLALWAPMVWLCWVTLVVASQLAQAHDATARELDGAYSALLDGHQERLSSLEGLSSRVAHEIKNPLSAIKGLTQLLQRKGDPTGHLKVIAGEVERLEHILNGLLTFARPIDRLNLADVALAPVASSVLTILSAKLAEAGIEASVQSPDGEVVVAADVRSLTQILLNLALNAVEAMSTVPGPHTLTLTVRRVATGAEIEVRDSGPGLHATLVDPFRPYASTRATGTGLGLPISRTMARAHGGELTLASHPDGGAVALLSLPRHPPIAPAQEAA